MFSVNLLPLLLNKNNFSFQAEVQSPSLPTDSVALILAVYCLFGAPLCLFFGSYVSVKVLFDCLKLKFKTIPYHLVKNFQSLPYRYYFQIKFLKPKIIFNGGLSFVGAGLILCG